ncbi:hypothetical protein ACXR0O_14040 [Verrucomicrobiota bacterium sgz303538]
MKLTSEIAALKPLIDAMRKAQGAGKLTIYAAAKIICDEALEKLGRARPAVPEHSAIYIKEKLSGIMTGLREEVMPADDSSLDPAKAIDYAEHHLKGLELHFVAP